MKLPWATTEAALVDMQGQLLQQQGGGLGEAMEANKRVLTLLHADSHSVARQGASPTRVFVTLHFTGFTQPKASASHTFDPSAGCENLRG